MRGRPLDCLTACTLLQTNTVKAMNYLTALFFAADAIMKMTAQRVPFTPPASALHLLKPLKSRGE